MNCDTFRKLLRVIQKDSAAVKTEELRRWESHMQDCESCLAFFRHAEEETVLSAFENDLLAETVLMQTVGGTSEQDAILQQLASLQYVEPPPEFADEVLARTASQRVRKQYWSRVKGVCRTLILRPRFAQEFSFAMTVCWVLVFGLPSEDFMSAEEFKQWTEQMRETLTLDR